MRCRSLILMSGFWFLISSLPAAAHDDVRFASSPLKPWFDQLKAATGCAAALPMALPSRTSIGTCMTANTACGSTVSGYRCPTTRW